MIDPLFYMQPRRTWLDRILLRRKVAVLVPMSSIMAVRIVGPVASRVTSSPHVDPGKGATIEVLLVDGSAYRMNPEVLHSVQQLMVERHRMSRHVGDLLPVFEAWLHAQKDAVLPKLH